ncbi:DMT family transporter [Salininema proteolyticum]|uniref:DMT family transporter n=1 Tax=Salininema proteolyticum TaxID=1607685 RepID=A0ABV8U0Z8_9ACTN
MTSTATAERPSGRTSPEPSRALAYAAVALVVTSWSSAFVVLRYLHDQFDPFTLSLGRTSIALLVLVALSLFARNGDPWLPRGRKEWTLVLVCGIGWFFAYHVALNFAVRYIDAGTSSILVNIGPLLIIAFAIVFFGEKTRWNLFLGAAVSFTGILLIGLASADTAQIDWKGVVLCLLAALLWSVGSMTQKPLFSSASALRVTVWTTAVGVLAALPFSAASADLSSVTPAGWGMLVYLGVVPTAIGFAAWAYAMSKLKASNLGTFTYLVPPLAILMGWVFLGELPPWMALAGSAICLAGVIIAKYERKA